MFCELLGLLWIEAQKEGRDDGPQADTTLNAAVVDAVAKADTVDDLWVLLDYWSVVTGVIYRCESRWLGNTRP